MYSTASGSDDLLDVALEAAGAHVSTPFSSSVSIFSVPSVDTDPNTFTATPLTLAQLQNLFQTDLSGNSLAAPIILGFVLNDLPVPTVDMGSGVLAQVSDTATADDQAQGGSSGTATPEPFTLYTFGCGAVCLCLSHIRRKGSPQ
jgi:hypothetical protein